MTGPYFQSDCEMYGHPKATDVGCPCGHLVRTPTEPQPWPPPLEDPPAAPMLRLLLSDRYERTVAARRATRARKAC